MRGAVAIALVIALVGCAQKHSTVDEWGKWSTATCSIAPPFKTGEYVMCVGQNVMEYPTSHGCSRWAFNVKAQRYHRVGACLYNWIVPTTPQPSPTPSPPSLCDRLNPERALNLAEGLGSYIDGLQMGTPEYQHYYAKWEAADHAASRAFGQWEAAGCMGMRG